MQITLVSSSGSISDVLDQFKTLFSLSVHTVEEKLVPWMPSTDFATLVKAYSIRELKKMTDFLASSFKVTDLENPKRNSKVSLADWISKVLLSVCEMVDASKAIAVQPVEASSPNSTCGLIVSFGKTLEFLPRKTVTRRTWKDVHAQKFINAFNQNKLVKAFDKDIRYGGKQIGWCRLLCSPYKERLCDMPKEDLLAEGGMCGTIGEFVQQYFDGSFQLEVWVIRFEFIPGLIVATEVNPVASVREEVNVSEAIEQSIGAKCPDCGLTQEPGQNSLRACGDPVPEVEIMEPEKKPVYTIALIADGSFSEERVNRIPPYLLDRKGRLLQRFWYRSCDAGYSEIVSEHLSNIAVDSGLVIKLMAEDLQVTTARIAGDPPPFLIYERGVYKRDRVKLSLAVPYFQVISEHLSNIVVV